jgi:hypothetical protein
MANDLITCLVLRTRLNHITRWSAALVRAVAGTPARPAGGQPAGVIVVAGQVVPAIK